MTFLMIMKMTLVRIILCAAALVCTTAWQANAQNLVANGGFETGDFSSWTHSGDANGFDTVGDVSTFAHSGTHYAALGSFPDSGRLEQNLVQFLDGCIPCSFISQTSLVPGVPRLPLKSCGTTYRSTPPVIHLCPIIGKLGSLCEPQPAPRHHYGSFTSTPPISGMLMMCP